MYQVELDHFLYNYSYFTLFGLSFGYFLALYFGLAPLFNWVCELLSAKKILHKIVLKEISKKQILFERFITKFKSNFLPDIAEG